MDLEDFLKWYGWTAVGSIATVLALAALVFATVEFVVKRRQVPVFMLGWEAIATTTTPTGEFHLFEFHNFGRGPGRLVSLTLCGAWAKLDDEHRTPQILAPGGTFQLLVSSPDLEQAWVRYTYGTQADRRTFHVRWEPLITQGAMADEFAAQQDKDAAQPWIRRIFHRYRVTSVAPGGVWYGVARGRNGGDKAYQMIIGGPAGAVYRETVARQVPPSLPYVSPPV
ncbi:hypothetical protein [Microbacterium sp. NPDC087589]|uniref:hypothetical protein n=1 Tax=Microbacterium sp. NPDC087589 TaxID=3364191 RepID=UPI003820A0F6